MIFDGKAFARTIEAEVKNKVRNLVKKPLIVSVMVGDDPASALYTRLKEQAAHRVDIGFEVQRISNIEYGDLIAKITEIGSRDDVSGVMVQLPLPGVSRKDSEEILKAIPLAKDVDGLRWEESGVMPATVRAILSILDKIAQSQIKNSQILKSGKYVVLGARGAVGKPLVHYLRKRGAKVTEVEWNTPNPAGSLLEGEVVISCVGKAGLVTGEMMREGVVAIDVGMSTVNNQSTQFGDWNLDVGDSRQSRVVGDMTNEVYQKASVAVPVPGGVGPVTVACLMNNAVDLI